jgi:hypothetical protein
MEVDGADGGTNGEAISTGVDNDAPAAAEADNEGEVDLSSVPPKSDVERAAAVALGAAAAKASALATHEDRRMNALVSRLVAAQVRKVELKLTMFERLEEVLENEHRKLEQSRQSLYKEKKTLASRLVQADSMIKELREKGAAVSREAAAAREAREKAQAQGRPVQSPASQAPAPAPAQVAATPGLSPAAAPAAASPAQPAGLVSSPSAPTSSIAPAPAPVSAAPTDAASASAPAGAAVVPPEEARLQDTLKTTFNQVQAADQAIKEHKEWLSPSTADSVHAVPEGGEAVEGYDQAEAKLESL